MIIDFRVDHGAGFDVHDAFKIKMNSKQDYTEVTTKKYQLTCGDKSTNA